MPIAPDSPIPMRALLAGARRSEVVLLDLLRRLVLAESPSDDKKAVDGCMALAAAIILSMKVGRKEMDL